MWYLDLMVLLIVLVGLAASIFVIYQFYSYYIRCKCGKYGPFVSSYGKLKEDILDESRAILKKSKKTLKVTDLGCGSGALLLPLAKEFPQHQFIGLEWDVVPLTMGKVKAAMAGLKNIRFVKGDYMKDSNAEMDLILCYVHKVTGEPLGKKLAKEIKDTAIVISEMFPLGHLQEIKQIKSSLAGIPEKIFIYKKPDKKAKVISEKKVAITSKTAPKNKAKATAKSKKINVKGAK